MNVLFAASFLGTYSVHRAQIELVLKLKNEVDNLLLIGEFSEKNIEILISNNIRFINKKIVQKVDEAFISELKKIAQTFKPDIVHAINSRLLRQVNIAFKKHPAKIIGYFGSTSLYWHDIGSYFTFLSPRVDKIICNSNFVFNHVRKQLFWRKHKAVKIYKGYNPEWFSNIKPFDYTLLNIPNNAFVVALAASNSKNKRIKDFINSSNFLNTSKEVHYVVFGHGTMSRELIELKKESSNANHIHLLGLRHDAIELIKATDIYVQTSLKEGFGRAVSEAMCVGKPIIMTNCGGGTELIDEKSGIIVPVKSPENLGKAISKLINEDSLRKNMGVNAKKRIGTVYHISRTIKDIISLYKDILK